MYTCVCVILVTYVHLCVCYTGYICTPVCVLYWLHMYTCVCVILVTYVHLCVCYTGYICTPVCVLGVHITQDYQDRWQ